MCREEVAPQLEGLRGEEFLRCCGAEAKPQTEGTRLRKRLLNSDGLYGKCLIVFFPGFARVDVLAVCQMDGRGI